MLRRAIEMPVVACAPMDAERASDALKWIRHKVRNRYTDLLFLALMDELAVNLSAILASRRWIVGNKLAMLFNAALSKPSRPTAADRILEISSDYSQWKSETLNAVRSGRLTKDETRQICAWIDELADVFHRLLRSRRWKIGNFLVDTARLALMRPRQMTAPVYVRELLASYRNLVNTTGFSKNERLSLADIYYHLGYAREQLQQWHFAAIAYETALQLKEPRPGQFYRLGRVREHQKLWQEAASAYSEAVRRNPTKAHWFSRLARTCAMNRQWEAAASALESATTLDPEKPNWFYQLGHVREKVRHVAPRYLQHGGLQLGPQGDWLGAAQAYTAAITLDPLNASYHYRLGHVLDKARDFEGAARSLSEAIRLAPETPRWLYRLGRAREQALDLPGALRAYQQALALEPEHQNAQARVLTIHLKLSNWHAAGAQAAGALKSVRATSSESSSQRRYGSDPPAILMIRALLKKKILPTEREARRILSQCHEFTHLLPHEWWLVLHWRFMAEGLFSLAYETKDIAASLIASHPAQLTTHGLTRFLETAKAYQQLGRTAAAIEHLQGIEKESTQSDVTIAARKLIADIEAFTGNFSMLSRDLGTHDGANLPKAEETFQALIRDKSVAVVGPLDNGLKNGEEIDSFDTVIRPNFLPSIASESRTARLGTRTDISYFNGVASQMLTDEICRAVEQKSLRLVVLRPFNFRADRRYLVSPGDLRYNPAESNAFLRARSFGIQRILHDVLRYGPKRLKLFNIDFFLSSLSYKQGYTAGELLADIDPYFLGSGHDYRGDFLFTQNLNHLSRISGDRLVEDILQLPAASYLQALEKKSEWIPRREDLPR